MSNDTSRRLDDFVMRYKSRITPPRADERASSEAPRDVCLAAKVLRSFAFDDLVTISLRGHSDESPFPEVFPRVEILCRDDHGNLIISDYQSTSECGQSLIVYLCHDPFGFVIVANTVFGMLDDIAKYGSAYRPLRTRYFDALERAIMTFDSSPSKDRRVSLLAVGDGMRLFDESLVHRVPGPGITVDISY
jgi:hypothetical protein